MKKLLLILLTACNFDEPNSTGCGNDSVCHAAMKIADSYCERRNVCWQDDYYACHDQVIETICHMYDCWAYYPKSNQQALAECITWYDGISCRDQEPPVCKVY